MIKCDTCPRCKDTYPGAVDHYGYPFRICGLTGNMVYVVPRKIKRRCGKGYIYHGISSCGLYETVEDALAKMTESERRTWREGRETDDTDGSNTAVKDGGANEGCHNG